MSGGRKHSDTLKQNASSDTGISAEQLREVLNVSDIASFQASVRDVIEMVGEFRAVEAVREAAQQDLRAVPMLVELMRSHSHSSDKFGRVIFHATRTQGLGTLRLIRETWAKETDPIVLARLHMCMMDCIGFHGNHPDRLLPVANEEIPEWLSMLDGQNPQAQGWIIWLVAALSRHAPQYVDKVHALATEATASPDQSAQMDAQRALQILTVLNESAFGGDDED
jgi:hypothetical protein